MVQAHLQRVAQALGVSTALDSAEALQDAVDAVKGSGQWLTVPRATRSMATSLLKYLKGEVPVYAAEKRAAAVADALTQPGRRSAIFRVSVPTDYVERWEAMDSLQRGDFIARAFAAQDGGAVTTAD